MLGQFLLTFLWHNLTIFLVVVFGVILIIKLTDFWRGI